MLISSIIAFLASWPVTSARAESSLPLVVNPLQPVAIHLYMLVSDSSLNSVRSCLNGSLTGTEKLVATADQLAKNTCEDQGGHVSSISLIPVFNIGPRPDESPGFSCIMDLFARCEDLSLPGP